MLRDMRHHEESSSVIPFERGQTGLGLQSPPHYHHIPQHHYKIILVSDIHIPRRDSQTDYLLEFLRYNTCDTLIFLGDAHEGFDRELDPLREQDKQLLRYLAYRKSEGMQHIDISGNHDAYKRSDLFLGRRIFGTDYHERMILNDGTLDVLLEHGDATDGEQRRRFEQLLYKFASLIKVGKKKEKEVSLVQVYERLDFLQRSILGKYKSTKKKNDKTWKKKRNGFEAGMAKAAFLRNADAAIGGHTHGPIAPFGRKYFEIDGQEETRLIGNTGSWTDKQGTAIVFDEEQGWRLIDWREERRKYMASLPDINGLFAASPEIIAQADLEYEWQRAAHGAFTASKLLEDKEEILAEIEKKRKKLIKIYNGLSRTAEKNNKILQDLSEAADVRQILSPQMEQEESGPECVRFFVPSGSGVIQPSALR